MTDKLISLQAAVDALHDEIVRRRISEDSNDNGTLDEFDTEAILRRLPSAQPERNKGRWIKWGNRYKCDQCYLINAFKKPFCPNCGTDMRGEQNE